jgi:hypothetical protein
MEEYDSRFDVNQSKIIIEEYENKVGYLGTEEVVDYTSFGPNGRNKVVLVSGFEIYIHNYIQLCKNINILTDIKTKIDQEKERLANIKIDSKEEIEKIENYAFETQADYS